MIDPISLLAGAAVLAAGLLAGHLSGRHAERRRQDRPQQPICGCTHHLAKHDRKDGVCHTTWLVDRREFKDGRTRDWEERVQCRCRQYVGPLPISEVWVPPAAVESADR